VPAASQLKYRVVKCSSEDPEYPVSELLASSPQTRGWQTARYCEYPQEIGLEFDTPVHLRQVKFLSHQTKIATKIELFTAMPPTPEDGEPSTYDTVPFKRLGYLSLDSNERSQFQARELKTVDVDISVQYLRILFHKCHVNKFNSVNQVGLIALYCLGRDLDPTPIPRQPSLPQPLARPDRQAVAAEPSHGNATREERQASRGSGAFAPNGAEPDGVGPAPVSRSMAPPLPAPAPAVAKAVAKAPVPAAAPPPAIAAAPARSSPAEPAQASAAEPWLEGKVQEQLRRLNLAKQRAIEDEDYDEAKRLKVTISKMQQIGPQLKELEEKKRLAVEGEDFDAAKNVKVEIQRLRFWLEDPEKAEAEEAAAAKATQASHAAPPAVPATAASAQQPSSRGAQQPSDGQGLAAFGATPSGGAGGGGSGGGYPGCRGGGGHGESSEEEEDEQQQEQLQPPPPKHWEGAAPGPAPQSPAVAALAAALAAKPGRAGPPKARGGQSSASPPAAAATAAAAGGLAAAASAASRGAPPALGSRATLAGPDAGPYGSARDQTQPPASFSVVEADHPFAGIPNVEDRGAPEPLAAAVANEASPLIPLFGEYITCSLYSKTWNLRDAALQKLAIDLREGSLPGSSPREPPASFARLARALAVVLKRTLADRNVQVFTAAAGVLQALCLSSDGPTPRLNEAKAAIEPLLPALADRLGESNARADHTAREAHLHLARWPGAGAPFAAQCLLQPPAKRALVPPRVFSSRLQLLSALVAEAGLQPEDPQGLPLDPVMKLAMECFSNRDAEVRESSVRLVAACFARVGLVRIEKYLANLRNTQREVFDIEFERVAAAGPGAYLGAPGRRHNGDNPPTPSGSVCSGRLPPSPSAAQGMGFGAEVAPGGWPTGPGGPGGHAMQKIAPGGAEDGYDEEEGFTCQFCERYDPSFTEEALDIHYWRECTMLTECSLCTQVVEIERLHSHLLDECEVEDRAVAAAERLAPSSCPLCGAAMGRCTDREWRHHLLDGNGCPRNPRLASGASMPARR